MSEDIVERLYKLSGAMGSFGSIEREAADEIKRLREALTRIQHEAIIRQPATAVQTVADLRAIAREAYPMPRSEQL